MSTILREVEHLFSNNDGSLPEIAFAVANPGKLPLLYHRIQAASSHLESEGAYYWSRSQEAEIPIQFGDEPTLALVSGDAEPFHVVFGGILSRSNFAIPPLGVYCFLGELALDYRMGSDWNEQAIQGLFELLDDLAKILGTDAFDHRENERDDSNKLLSLWRSWRPTHLI